MRIRLIIMVTDSKSDDLNNNNIDNNINNNNKNNINNINNNNKNNSNYTPKMGKRIAKTQLFTEPVLSEEDFLDDSDPLQPHLPLPTQTLSKSGEQSEEGGWLLPQRFAVSPTETLLPSFR